MTKRRPFPGLTILKVFAGFVGTALVFVLANRRLVTVGYRFAVWEFTEQGPLFVAIGGFTLLLPITYLLLWVLRIPILSPRLLFARHMRWSVAALATFLGTLLILSIPYLRQRYAYVSEASFQIRALKNAERRKFQEARAICTDYVALFPQRRVNGPWPDPVCAPILTFTDDMGVITAYLQNRPAPAPQMRDGVWLPVDFTMRGPAIKKTRDLAGGRIATPERSTPKEKKVKEQDGS
jgi:hypothetical protein